MLNYLATQPQRTVAQGVTLTIDTPLDALNHSFTIERGTSTAGSVAVTAVSPGQTSAEVVNDQNGAAVVKTLTVAGATTYSVQGFPLAKIVFTPTSDNGTWLVTYNGSW